jgi:hypothetical protein
MGKFPKYETIHRFVDNGLNDNELRLLDILDKCDNSGFMKIMEGEELKGTFYVKQILYSGQWERFEKHNSKGNPDGTCFNTYIMPFNQFQKLGRPKKIYIDFYNSVIV